MPLKIVTAAQVTVTTAGTRVQAAAAANAPLGSQVTFSAPTTNTGVIFVGDSSVSATQGVPVAPGGSYSIQSDNAGRRGDEFKISDFWFDAATSGNKVNISYIRHES